MNKLSDFDEIRPYEASEMPKAFNELLSDKKFQRVIKGFTPWMPRFMRSGLLKLTFLGVKSPLDFQKRYMRPIVKYIINKCTDGVSVSGMNHLNWDKRYTFISNHRDIVLDSAFLDLLLIENGAPTTVEIGIGDNLLIYPWIKHIVKMNKAFTVRRSLSPREMLKSSVMMSDYIHFAVNEKKENIWIAQREGRAKDSNDRTQESVLKMLAYGGGDESHVESLKDLHIIPLTISYEYDPCDYLKAKEFQLKRDNPSYKKTRQDDLDNMKTGILGYKGRVHYDVSPCIDNWLNELEDMPYQEFYGEVARRMDKRIHQGYQLFPNNYIALDKLNGNYEMAEHYTSDDKVRFEQYLKKQIEKIDIPGKDERFLMERMLTMYANPLRNYLAAVR